MKSTLTDQELIDASKGAMLRGHQKLTPAHFTPEMLQSMRDIADAAVEKHLGAGVGFSIFPPPTRPAPPMPKIATPSYEEKLRDDFARTALICVEGNPRQMALMAYEIADAMLAERAKAK